MLQVVIRVLCCQIFFLILCSSLKAKGVKNELDDIKEANIVINKYIKKFNEYSFSFSALRNNHSKQALHVKKTSVEGECLQLQVVDFVDKREKTLLFPLTGIDDFCFDDIEFRVSKKESLFFREVNQSHVFFNCLLRIKEIIHFKESALKKIMSILHIKEFVRSDEIARINKELSDIDRLKYFAIRHHKLKLRLKKIVELFEGEYSIYTFQRKGEKHPDNFERLSYEFLEILHADPSLINAIEVGRLVDIFKQVGLENLHVGRISDLYHDFFVKKARYLLLMLRRQSELNGIQLLKCIKGESITDELFYQILRTESDLVWLSVVRNHSKSDDLECMRMSSKADEISKVVFDLYNFDDLIKVAKIHVVLFLKLRESSGGEHWDEMILRSLSEMDNEENRRQRRDFSFPYGRWAQGGQMLSEYMKIHKKLAEKEPLLYKEWMRHLDELYSQAKDLTYKDFLEKITRDEDNDKKTLFELMSLSAYQSVVKELQTMNVVE